MNKVIIIGRLSRDPEMRTTASGINTTMFNVAVSRNYTGSSGSREADFINCIAWRKQAENIAKYCKKGSQVAVEGRIQTRNYSASDGTKRYITEIIADNVTFLGNRPAGSTVEPENEFVGEEDIATTDITEDPFKDFGEEVALSDDDLPF